MNEKLKEYFKSKCELKEFGYWELRTVEVLLFEELTKIKIELEKREEKL